MNREAAVKSMIAQVFPQFRGELQGHRVVLFGSRAEGTHRPRSDFDIGVVGPKPLPLKTFYRIEDELDALDTLYRVDWVDINRVSERFRKEALNNCEVLYEA